MAGALHTNTASAAAGTMIFMLNTLAPWGLSRDLPRRGPRLRPRNKPENRSFDLCRDRTSRAVEALWTRSIDSGSALRDRRIAQAWMFPTRARRDPRVVRSRGSKLLDGDLGTTQGLRGRGGQGVTRWKFA